MAIYRNVIYFMIVRHKYLSIKEKVELNVMSVIHLDIIFLFINCYFFLSLQKESIF